MTEIDVQEAQPNVGPGGVFGMSCRIDRGTVLIEQALDIQRRDLTAPVDTSAEWRVDLNDSEVIALRVRYESPFVGEETYRFRRGEHEAALRAYADKTA